jgi:site-specific DNA recombinase
MINALIYIRVSTDEQAERGFSLDAQLEVLMKYAIANKINVLKVFKEDYSARKGFERPAYRELKEFVKLNKQVNQILVTQWSRFSRNFTESTIELKDLKERGIELKPVEQLTDDTIPENLLLKAIHMVMPQIENERLSLRTKAGMRQAMKQGRYLHKAPFGYVNNRLSKLLEIDDTKAEIVRECFEMMATGLYSSEEIRRELYYKGLTLTKQALLNMFQNIIYTGRLVIPAYKDEVEEIVYGQHHPIVDVETFNNVQLVIKGKKKPYQGHTKKEDLPLVGALVCKCGKIMTGSHSRSRNKSLIPYYHCQRTHYGCKNSFNANKANTIFHDYIKQFEFEPEIIELYHHILEDVFKTNGNEREIEKNRLEKEIASLEERLEIAAEKNMNGIWDDATYIKTKRRIDEQLNELVVRHATLKSMPTEFAKYISYSTSLLSDLPGYYKAASVGTKKKLVGLIFPEKLRFENNNYQTGKINEVLGLLCSVGKGFNKKQPRKNSRLSSIAPQSGLEPETL